MSFWECYTDTVTMSPISEVIDFSSIVTIMAVMPIERNVFFHENLVFSSLNVATLPPIPNYLENRDLANEIFANDDPKAAQTVQWAMDSYPQVAWTPLHHWFEGPSFLQLTHDQYSLPIQLVDGMRKLSPSLAKTWQVLENGLIHIADHLLGRGVFLFPLNFGHLPHPSAKGYLCLHKLKRHGVGCALTSHDAFLPLMALKDNGIHSEWAGVLVHVSNFHNPSLLPLMLANSVPIWYYWGQWQAST
ncbi:hypothetical protein BU17DRAFT_78744 [Hysterangium stoloniferum]|nr:hypothetical protein BU17DRAFT_78744 [Hysterangium stoloniferum]